MEAHTPLPSAGATPSALPGQSPPIPANQEEMGVSLRADIVGVALQCLGLGKHAAGFSEKGYSGLDGFDTLLKMSQNDYGGVYKQFEEHNGRPFLNARECTQLKQYVDAVSKDTDQDRRSRRRRASGLKRLLWEALERLDEDVAEDVAWEDFDVLSVVDGPSGCSLNVRAVQTAAVGLTQLASSGIVAIEVRAGPLPVGAREPIAPVEPVLKSEAAEIAPKPTTPPPGAPPPPEASTLRGTIWRSQGC